MLVRLASLARTQSRLGRIRRPEPTPHHEIGARRDRVGRVDLEQGQAPHHVNQLGRARALQQLRAHGDATRVGTDSS
jgi:hypothetical protein